MKHMAWLLLIVGAMCSAQTTTGQTGKSSISGRVVDLHTGALLRSAVVKIEQTQYQATTNDSGYFIMKDVAPGVYRISAMCVGYSRMRKDSVRVADDRPAVVDFTLPELNCDEYVDQARADIRRGIVKILISGLIIRTGPEIPENAEKFLTLKYGFVYEYVGCTFMCAAEYNRVVEKYLEERNGKYWRKWFNQEFDELKRRF